MTVKELEQALGMSRANIRFYEKEGLLSPLRLENGYRDYTPDDLETLRKIKLLRQLQVPVEDIRALQQGGKELTALLAAQEEDLRRRASDLEAARTLCRRMEADQVSYGIWTRSGIWRRWRGWSGAAPGSRAWRPMPCPRSAIPGGGFLPVAWTSDCAACC